jgi:hypothetical protein
LVNGTIPVHQGIPQSETVPSTQLCYAIAKRRFSTKPRTSGSRGTSDWINVRPTKFQSTIYHPDVRKWHNHLSFPKFWLQSMTLTAILLILTASCTHVAWNTLGKKRHPNLAFFTIACSCGTLLLLPALLWNHALWAHMPREVGLLLVLSGFWQAIYIGSLRHPDPVRVSG